MASRKGPPPLGHPFTNLYREHNAFVWRLLVRFGVSNPEDAMQEVFVVAHRKQAALKPGTSIRSWLYGISRRVAADHRRAHSRRERKHSELERQPVEHEDLESSAQDRALVRALERAFDELDPMDRELVLLKYVEGMTAREVAEALSMNSNTVASRTRRAKRRVAAILKESLPDE